MPDVSTETSKRGWGSRLGSSLSGMLIGVILFLSSFGVLFWNEGRADLSKVADDAIPISSDEVNSDEDAQGQLVSTSGVLTTDELLSDDLYLVPDNYVYLRRNVEVYSWVEKKSSSSEEKFGGSEEVETTYTYKKEWVSEPAESADFKIPEGHENVPKQLEDLSVTASNATVGVYTIDPEQASLPGAEDLKLTESNTQFSEDTTTELASGKYLFNGFGTLTAPEVGDTRISYQVVPSDQNVTVFGKLEGDKILTFRDKKGNVLYRVFSGSSSDDAVATLHGEYKTMLWVFRLIGFLMMWIGLNLVFGPIGVLAAVIPFLAHLTRSVVKIATFIVSLVATIITILVSMVLHNIWAVIAVLVLTAAAVYYWLKVKDKKQGGKASEPKA